MKTFEKILLLITGLMILSSLFGCGPLPINTKYGSPVSKQDLKPIRTKQKERTQILPRQ